MFKAVWNFLMSDSIWKGTPSTATTATPFTATGNTKSGSVITSDTANDDDDDDDSSTGIISIVRKELTVLQLFRVAEVLTHMVITTSGSTSFISTDEKNSADMSSYQLISPHQQELVNLQLLCRIELENKIHTICCITRHTSGTGNSLSVLKQKTMAAIMLLVYTHTYMQNPYYWLSQAVVAVVSTDSKIDHRDVPPHIVITDEAESLLGKKLNTWIEHFLQLLLIKDLLIQDLSVSGLCMLYRATVRLHNNNAHSCQGRNGLIYTSSSSSDRGVDAATTTNANANAVAVTKKTARRQSLSERVAQEVVSILCKEKKLFQPVGMAVAGETTATTSMTGASGVGGGAGGGTATNNNNNDDNNDPLLRAASLLTTELGMQFTHIDENRPNVPTTATSTTANSTVMNFGVFTTLAKLARKTGSDSLLFAMMPLIRKHMLLANLLITPSSSSSDTTINNGNDDDDDDDIYNSDIISHFHHELYLLYQYYHGSGNNDNNNYSSSSTSNASSSNSSSSSSSSSSNDDNYDRMSYTQSMTNEWMMMSRSRGNSHHTSSSSSSSSSLPSSSSSSSSSLPSSSSSLSLSLTKENLIQLFPKLFMLRYEPIPEIKAVIMKLYSHLFPPLVQKQYLMQYEKEVLAYCIQHLDTKNHRDRMMAANAIESILVLPTNSVHNTTNGSSSSSNNSSNSNCVYNNHNLIGAISSSSSSSSSSLWLNNHIMRVVDSLWDKGFSLLDDVFESCRTAGMNMMKVLHDSVLLPYCAFNSDDDTTTSSSSSSSNDTATSTITITDFDGDNIDNNTATASIVSTNHHHHQQQQQHKIQQRDYCIAFLIDKLLHKGLLSPCTEAKGVSFGILIKLITLSSKTALKHYQIQLISILIECMSAFEPSMLQYMQFHTSRLNITDEALERTRLSISQQSPMQESLNLLLQNIHVDLIPQVLMELNNQFMRGVGLATRVAAIQSLSYLAEIYPAEVGRHCVTVCQSLAYTLLRNTTSSSSYNSISSGGSGGSGGGVSLQRASLNGLGALAKVMPYEAVADTCRLLLNHYTQTTSSSSNNTSGSSSTSGSGTSGSSSTSGSGSASLSSVLSSDSSDYNRNEASLVIASCIRQLLTHTGDKLTPDKLLIQELLIACYIGKFEGAFFTDTSLTNSHHQSSLASSSNNSSDSMLNMNQSQAIWESNWNEMLLLSTYGTHTIALQKIFPFVLKRVNCMLYHNAWSIRCQAIALTQDITQKINKVLVAPHLYGVLRSLGGSNSSSSGSSDNSSNNNGNSSTNNVISNSNSRINSISSNNSSSNNNTTTTTTSSNTRNNTSTITTTANSVPKLLPQGMLWKGQHLVLETIAMIINRVAEAGPYLDYSSYTTTTSSMTMTMTNIHGGWDSSSSNSSNGMHVTDAHYKDTTNTSNSNDTITHSTNNNDHSVTTSTTNTTSSNTTSNNTTTADTPTATIATAASASVEATSRVCLNVYLLKRNTNRDITNNKTGNNHDDDDDDDDDVLMQLASGNDRIYDTVHADIPINDADMTDSSISKASWRVSIQSVIQLLLHETCRSGGSDTRGSGSSSTSTTATTSEYKLAAIRSLSSLPWATITRNNPYLFRSVLPTLCSLMGATDSHLDMKYIRVGVLQKYRQNKDMNMNMNTAMNHNNLNNSNNNISVINGNHNNTAVNGSVSSSSSSSSSIINGVSKPIKKATSSVPVVKKPADMFGSRYGSSSSGSSSATASATATFKRTRLNQTSVTSAAGTTTTTGVTSATTSTSVTTTSTSSSALGVNTTAMMISNVSTAPPLAPSMLSIPLGVPSAVTTVPSATPVSSVAVPSVAMPSVAVPSVAMPLKLHDAGFRKLVADCIINGWPSSSSPPSSSSSSSLAMNTTSVIDSSMDSSIDSTSIMIDRKSTHWILYWCFRALENEVWSLKRAALQLLGKLLVTYHHHLDHTSVVSGIVGIHSESEMEDMMITSLEFMMESYADKKHALLRQAALEYLCLCIKSTQGSSSFSSSPSSSSSLPSSSTLLPSSFSSLPSSSSSSAEAAVAMIENKRNRLIQRKALFLKKADIDKLLGVSPSSSSLSSMDETNADVLSILAKTKIRWRELCDESIDV